MVIGVETTINSTREMKVYRAREQQTRSQTAKVTRLIRMLRAHGLVHKISKTHRYSVSPQGHEITTALINARNAKIKTLTQLAA